MLFQLRIIPSLVDLGSTPGNLHANISSTHPDHRHRGTRLNLPFNKDSSPWAVDKDRPRCQNLWMGCRNLPEATHLPHTERMPENNTPSSAPVLGTPGDLIANIPGILGFFPTESLVFAAMFREGSGPRHTLGPVIRVNIDELHLLPELGQAITSVEADLIFCFAITEQANSATIEETVDTLFDAAEAGTIPITACWVTAGIYSGETYQLAFGPSPDELGSTCRGLSEWEHGRIAPITQAQATQNLLDHGHLPELTRTDAYSAYDRDNRFLTTEGIADLTTQAQEIGDDILHAIRTNPEGGAFDAALDGFDTIMHRATTRSPGTNHTALLQKPGLLRDSAAYLTSLLLRDAILHHAVHTPDVASDLFLAVAKTFNGTIRSNALCLFAISAIQRRLGMKAIPALEAAQITDPGHSFSALLQRGLMDGQSDSMVDACMRGNDMVRTHYGTRAGADPDESEPAQAA